MIHFEILNKQIVRFSLMQNDKRGQVTSGEKGYAEFLICTALFLKLGVQTKIYFSSLAVLKSFPIVPSINVP